MNSIVGGGICRAAVTLLLANVVAISAFACAQEPPRIPLSLDEAVVWEEEIRLEESDAVINVVPRVVWQSDGSILIADEQETQIRRYAKDGRLIASFGGKGEGPGEFGMFLSAVVLPGGMALAMDYSGRFARFDSVGGLGVTGQLPFVSVMDADLVGDSALVVVGRRTDEIAMAGRIHLWHLTSERVLASFFEVAPPRSLLSPISVSAGPRDLLISSGLKDTVFVFSPAGARLATIPVPAEYLRRFVEPEGATPPNWMQTFSVVHGGFWLADGSILIQYYDFGPDATPTFSLLRMRLDGRKLFELRAVPQLLAVDERGERLLFVAPGSLTPNVLRAARLRS